MSKLQELIRELCPDGVEYKKLRDICKLNRGTRVVRNDLSKDGEFEVYQNSLTPLGYYDKSNYPAYTTFIISAGAAGEIGFTEKPIWAADDCLCLTCPDNISSKYVYYCLLNNKLFLSSRVRKASVPRLARTAVEQFEIPVPPLPVQEEIVRILDHFTNLAAELQAELQARKEQYEYYCNKLLTFDKIGGTQSVTWMKMSEIGTFIRGNGLQKKDFTESGVPCIHYGQIYTYYGTFASKTKSFVSEETAKKCKKAHTGDLVIASTSENVEDVGKTVAWLGEEDIAISNHTLIFSHNQNPKYLSYLFQTEWFIKYKRRKAVGVKVIDIPQKALEDLCIPIPPLTEQERIVSVLDKFEALVNDLTEGLPAEIAAVQEQYEYYRNKLLSFPRTKISA